MPIDHPLNVIYRVIEKASVVSGLEGSCPPRSRHDDQEQTTCPTGGELSPGGILDQLPRQRPSLLKAPRWLAIHPPLGPGFTVFVDALNMRNFVIGVPSSLHPQGHLGWSGLGREASARLDHSRQHETTEMSKRVRTFFETERCSKRRYALTMLTHRSPAGIFSQYSTVSLVRKVKEPSNWNAPGCVGTGVK